MKVIVLCAPTGAGKTELTLQLNPQKFEIVSFDSRQVYRDLCIGTSKPTAEERERVPHHLVDFLESHRGLTAKEFVELAKKSVDSILLKNKIPILTCGTGFYLRAFLYGMYPFPEITLDVKKKIASMEPSTKWKTLGELDPKRQGQIHEKDSYRIDRALEIALSGWLWEEERLEGGYIHKRELEWIGIYLHVDREELYNRINRRSDEMIRSGLLEETKRVLDSYGDGCPALNSLGYNFAVENIRGKISLECLKEKFSQSHRNYAKRQITWFKKESLLKPRSWSEAFSFLKNIES